MLRANPAWEFAPVADAQVRETPHAAGMRRDRGDRRLRDQRGRGDWNRGIPVVADAQVRETPRTPAAESAQADFVQL